MENISLKRMRSSESLNVLQSKIYVNERIVNFHDSNRMKEIYDKTTKMLFHAARSVNKNGIKTKPGEKTPLSQLITLFGNGQIETTKTAEESGDEFLWIPRKAKCCNRETYVQSDCENCQNPLCEGCGFSCVDCSQFICNSCVTVFGSGDPDRPICERCLLFC